MGDTTKLLCSSIRRKGGKETRKSCSKSLEKLLPAVLLNLLPVVAVNASARETMASVGGELSIKGIPYI